MKRDSQTNNLNVSNVSPDSHVSLFILIDALGWNYIKEEPFLGDICQYRQNVKSLLGYSCGVIPSILTGKLPSEHKKFTLFYYAPQTSPFRWTKYVHWLPAPLLESRVSRKIIEEVSKMHFGYRGYFETYLLPVKLLYLFDLPERTNVYEEGAFSRIKTVFDIWKEQSVSYQRYHYIFSDEEIFERTKADLKKGKHTHYFLYFSDLDSFLHYHCNEEEKVKEKLQWYEQEIRSLYAAAKEQYKEITLCVFSDHGMVPVAGYIDLKGEVDSLGFKIPQDYVVLYDATMARFWFFNQEAKAEIKGKLAGLPCGRFYAQEDLEALGADFRDNRYGEDIFIMKPGAIILPSFMGAKKMSGMHGYDPAHSGMNASFLSSYEPHIELKDIRDFFKVMTSVEKSHSSHTVVIQ